MNALQLERPGPADELDRKAILNVVGGHVPLLHEIIDIFVSERAQSLEEVESALRARHPERLRLAAHALHGTAGNFRHRPSCTAARALEEMGRDRNLAGAEEAFVALTDALAQLELALLDLKSRTSY